MKKTIIVMPVANEETTMGRILDEILGLPYDNLHIYPVIDSYSKDRTEEIIRDRERVSDRVKCIFHEKSTGVISCYLEGFKRALADGAERIIEMDGGSMREQPLYRRILSQGGTFLSNAVLGTALKDMTSGFEGFQRGILEQLHLDSFLSTGHMYQTEMRYYCRNLRTVEVPIHYVGTASSLKGSSVTEAIKILFMLKKHEPEVCKWKR